jgi:hypothetical protein
LLLNGDASAQEGGKAIPKTTISLGTATPGGGFPIYGNAFAEAVNAADPTLSVEPRNTRGSNENIPLLEAGQLDIATVAGETSYEAFMDIGQHKTTHKILTAMYSAPACSWYGPIAPTRSFAIWWGSRSRSAPGARAVLSRYMLDGLGLKQDEDFRSIYLERAGDGPAMVQDGRAACCGNRDRLTASPRWRSAGGARFIAPDADESRASAPGTRFSSR